MSDIDVESASSETANSSVLPDTAPAAALDGHDALSDSLSDPLADGGDDGGDVQFFANGIPDGRPGLSLRSVKSDIAYLSEEESSSFLDAVLSVPLARFRYRDTDPAIPARLGFMIDDLPSDSPALAPDGKHVDTYGFTSMAVAALQSQQRELRALRAALAELRARLDRLEG